MSSFHDPGPGCPWLQWPLRGVAIRALEVFRLDGVVADDVAGVAGTGWLKEQQVRAACSGDGLVRDTSWDDEGLAWRERYDPLGAFGVTQVHIQRAIDDEEELVDVGVVVSDELALGFRELDNEPDPGTNSVFIHRR